MSYTNMLNAIDAIKTQEYKKDGLNPNSLTFE